MEMQYYGHMTTFFNSDTVQILAYLLFITIP